MKDAEEWLQRMSDLGKSSSMMHRLAQDVDAYNLRLQCYTFVHMAANPFPTVSRHPIDLHKLMVVRFGGLVLVLMLWTPDDFAADFGSTCGYFFARKAIATPYHGAVASYSTI
jgi:hypothetical protein